MSAHTPGPWKMGNENNQCCDVECGDGRTSISLSRFDSLRMNEFNISRDEMLANAHLVVASPWMLQMLKRAREELKLVRSKDGAPTYDPTLMLCLDDVIEMAEGKS